jgi:hypothetical protein
MRRVPIFTALAALAVVALVAAGRPGPGAAQDAAPAAHPIVGTWLLDTDAADPANAPEVAVFTADGAYVSVDAEEFTSLGVWEATGERTATLTIVTAGADEEGALFGTFTIRAAIEADASGDAFTAEYTGEFVAADGTASGEYGPGSAAATRLAAEAPGEPVGPLSELFAEEEGGATPSA